MMSKSPKKCPTQVTNVRVITDEMEDDEEDEEKDDPNAVEKKQVPKGVEIYEINGPLFFGAPTNLWRP